jgi:hypothetical protein
MRTSHTWRVRSGNAYFRRRAKSVVGKATGVAAKTSDSSRL